MRKLLVSLAILIFIGSVGAHSVQAQTDIPWSMAGANPQRTSWTPENLPGVIKAEWVKPIYPYVSQHVQVIGAEGKVFVSTAAGLYAFDAATGADLWRYATALPLGHSPTYDSGFLYVGGLDKKIHKVAATQVSSTAQAVWTSSPADGGFSTSPVVANGKVYAGNRDGAFYAYNTANGSLAWKYQTGNQILQSAAFQNNILYFASNDGYAYALKADTTNPNGELVWKSASKLPSLGFYAWWPVIYQNYVIFTRATFGSGHTGEESDYLFCNDPVSPATRPANGNGCTIPSGLTPGKLGFDPGSWASGTATMDFNQDNATTPIGNRGLSYADYFERFPHYRNAIFFDKTNPTGQEVRFDTNNDGIFDAAPVGWKGDGGEPSPPIVSGFDNVLYFRTYTRSTNGGGFGSKTIAGWKVGTGIVSLPYSNVSGQSGFWPGDEPNGMSASGDKIYWNHCCDRFVGAASLSIPNTDFLANGDDGNRQWRYVSSSGLPFLSWPTNLGIPNHYFQEAAKYFWDPKILVDDPNTAEVEDPTTPCCAATFWNENDKVGPTAYKQKLYVILGNALVAFSSTGAGNTASILPSAPNVSPPSISSAVTDAQLKSHLETEVGQMIAAGHLKPSYLWSGNVTSYRSRFFDDYLGDYWHNPADTQLILLRALPFLPTSPVNLQQQVKSYLQTEMANYNPATYAHVGYTVGTQRDPYPYPPAETAFRSFTIPNLAKQTGSSFDGWGFPPYNVYALWKYAQEPGLCVAPGCTPASLMTQWGNRLKVPIELNFGTINGTAITSGNIRAYLKGFPLVSNAYIAAYKGYVELAKLAGQSQSQWGPFETELNKLLDWKRQDLMTFPNPQAPYMCEGECYFESLITYFNFAYLTPELADYLYANDRTQVLAIINTYQTIAPYWMQAHNGETQGESVIQPYQQTHSLFQALAQVKHASRDELLKYLDTPIVPVGDLYYIDNLVAVLEASGTSPTSPPASSPTSSPVPSPTPVPYDPDINNDGVVNATDVRLVLGALTATGCGNAADANHDCAVNTFDIGVIMAAMPTPSPVGGSNLQSGTGHANLPAAEWTWPIPTGSPLETHIHSLMDDAIDQARADYGSNQAKIVMLENNTALLGDFAAKAQAAFPQALVVGVGPGNDNYNGFTDKQFSEHSSYSLAVLALGGTNISQVRSSGQRLAGQGSNVQQQIDAGTQIGQDLRPFLNPSQKNLIHFFGPGHTPNHKQVLCGIKQGIAGVTGFCDPLNPDNPEEVGLPQLPSYVHIIGASSYYGGKTVVNTSEVNQSVIGVLIQGTFQMAVAGGVNPTTANITTPINQVTQSLGGIPQLLFFVPGHPVVGNYEALRQTMTSLLPGTTIFGHEGGGEIGHDLLSGPATAVTDHLYMVGLKGN